MLKLQGLFIFHTCIAQPASVLIDDTGTGREPGTLKSLVPSAVVSRHAGLKPNLELKGQATTANPVHAMHV